MWRASAQGEVAQARQIVVRFDEAVVPFGDLRLPDPMMVVCEGAAPAGSSRWTNDRTWLYDSREAVPPGTRCTLTARTDWRPNQGALTGPTSSPSTLVAQRWCALNPTKAARSRKTSTSCCT